MLWLLEELNTVSFDALLPLLPRLSDARRSRVLSMRHESTQVQMILSELLLRHALREEYALPELPKIETGKKGKPFFPGHPEIRFNLSHCKRAVACALDSAPVGVDVEQYGRLRRDGTLPSASTKPALFGVLSEAERDWVLAGETTKEQDRRFTAVWTCKEAWGKARGEGILYDLRSTEFLPHPGAWQQYGCRFFQAELKSGVLTLCAAHELPFCRVNLSELLV